MDTFHRLAIVGRGIKWMKMLIPLKKNTKLTNVWSQINMSNFHPLEVVGRGSETNWVKIIR